jgi:hypothetical protein
MARILEKRGRPSVREQSRNRLLTKGVEMKLKRNDIQNILLFLMIAVAPLSGLAEFAYAGNEEGALHALYAEVLKETVKDGMVDYAGLKRDSVQLKAYLHQLQKITGDQYEEWQPATKIAYWLNLYNAGMLQAVLESYPVKRGWGWRALKYPENSVRHIADIFSAKRFEVQGHLLSLDDVEHEKLRKLFSEPRIHFALVCAARSCPPLRGEPYEGARLESQLEDQGYVFMNHSKKNNYDAESDTLFLSPIFDWFSSDFSGIGLKETALNYLPDTIQAKISDATQISWTSYDWSLNDRP